MGMGFFLVFFPEEQDPDQNQKKKPNSNNSSPFSSPLKQQLKLNRTNSTHLIQKAQSTISICLLLLFTTLLLFTLSTLPTATPTAAAVVPRRHLREFKSPASNFAHALQGMGTLYRRGTRAMADLIVAHTDESLTAHELKLFLRLLYRSSLSSRSDLLLIFPTKKPEFDNAITQENTSFMKLLTHYSSEKSSKNHSKAGFDPTHFLKLSKKEKESGESIWGQKIRDNSTDPTHISYGSVVGFDVEELDPENSLSGFLDHVPISLRRWACYPMLLGRVRRNFKHIMLVDVKEILLLGDPLGRVRGQSPETVFIKAGAQSKDSKHGRKNSEKNRLTREKPAHPGMIMGGSRGVRRLSNAMLTDIVRASIQHKKKNQVIESGIFGQLVTNEFVLKNVKLTVSSESIPEAGLVFGSGLKTGTNYTMVRRGNSGLDVSSVVMKHICSFPIDSRVYSDC